MATEAQADQSVPKPLSQLDLAKVCREYAIAIAAVITPLGAVFSFALAQFAGVYEGPGLAAFFWSMFWLVAALFFYFLAIIMLMGVVVAFAPTKGRANKAIGILAMLIGLGWIVLMLWLVFETRDRFGSHTGEISRALRDYPDTNGKAP